MKRKAKCTDFIDLALDAKIIDAALYAFCIGCALNRHITIHFEKAGVYSFAEAHEALGDYLKLAGDWLYKRGAGPAYYVYAFENPPDDGLLTHNGGLHVHILMYVPFKLRCDFRAAEQQWVDIALRRVGGENRPKVLVDDPCRKVVEYRKGWVPLDVYIEEGVQGALLYLLKGGAPGTLALLGKDDEAAKHLPEKLRPKPQGPIEGKRAGYSESLGLARRVFPKIEIKSRKGMWITGNEARQRYILHVCGLEFSITPR